MVEEEAGHQQAEVVAHQQVEAVAVQCQWEGVEELPCLLKEKLSRDGRKELEDVL